MMRSRFSLRSLLLATTFIVMALAIVLLTLELIPLRAEVQRLRNEAGYLTIDDPAKVHAIQVDTESPLVWKWKVSVPPADKCIGVSAIVGEFPVNNRVPKRTGGLWMKRSDAIEGIVTARVHTDLEGEWVLTTTLSFFGNESNDVVRISEDQLKKLRNGYTEQIGRSTRSSDLNEDFVLFRRMFHETGQLSADEGILIWMHFADRN